MLHYFLKLPRRGSSNGSLHCFKFFFGSITEILFAASVDILLTWEFELKMLAAENRKKKLVIYIPDGPKGEGMRQK